MIRLRTLQPTRCAGASYNLSQPLVVSRKIVLKKSIIAWRWSKIIKIGDLPSGCQTWQWTLYHFLLSFPLKISIYSWFPIAIHCHVWWHWRLMMFYPKKGRRLSSLLRWRCNKLDTTNGHKRLLIDSDSIVFFWKSKPIPSNSQTPQEKCISNNHQEWSRQVRSHLRLVFNAPRILCFPWGM